VTTVDPALEGSCVGALEANEGFEDPEAFTPPLICDDDVDEFEPGRDCAVEVMLPSEADFFTNP